MSNSHINRNTTSDRPIDDQAVAWLALLRGDSVTVAQQAEFAEWLTSERDHQAAFDELTELWTALREPLTALADTEADSAPYLSLNHDKTQTKTPTRRSPTVRLALAASAVLTVAAGLLVAALSYSPVEGSALERWAGLWQGLSASGQHAVSTAVGEQRNLTLTDGSQITLNTRSSVVISINDQNREIRLESGQAFFEVAKNESKPFRVDAGDVTVTAIGTAFSVHRTSDSDADAGTTIVVEEGIVELCSSDKVWRLGANEQANVVQGKVTTSSVLADSATAWRHGRLIYSDVPLSQVIQDLNRYLPHPMTIRGDELAAVKVSAVLQLSQQSDMLDALSHALPMSWQLMSDSLVIIRPTPEFKAKRLATDEA